MILLRCVVFVFLLFSLASVLAVEKDESSNIHQAIICPPDYVNLRGVCSYAVPSRERDFTAASESSEKLSPTSL